MDELLKLLKRNALESTKNLAKMLNLAEKEVKAKIADYEKRGIIRGYQAIVNEDQLNLDSVSAVIEVKITPERDGGFDRVAALLSRFPEVQSLFLMSGTYDLLVFVSGRNLREVASFVSEKLATLDGVLSTSTHFMLKTYKDQGVLMEVEKENERLQVWPSRVAAHLRDVPRSGIRDFFDIVSTRKDVISLGIGEPDFVTPWHIREASIFALDRGATGYTANLGLLELREEIASYVQRSYHATYDPRTEILVAVGVSEALDLAIRAVVEPGDEVLYHEPCYVSYGPVVTFAHGKPVPVPTRMKDDFRLTRAMLEKHVTPRSRVLLLNFPTNPTGAISTRADVQGLAQFAVEHDLIVITDEIYSELSYGVERPSIAAEPGMKERTIFLNGFSKAWAMTGFRIGFACAPPELTEAMMKIHQYTMLCAPILAQKAAIEALRNGDRDVEEMRGEYEKRRNFIHAALNEMGLPCFWPQGAFYAFPYVGGCGLKSKDFALRLLDEQNVACVPGSAFGASGEGFLRCSYATKMESIKAAMLRMDKFVHKLKR